MLHFLKLIRIQNLFIVAATQYLMRYAIIKPSLDYKYTKIFGRELYLQFSDLNFFLLVLATVLITAAGYVINDYFDRKTDLFNRPDTVIVGKHIQRRYAMAMHWIFNIVAILLGFYVSYEIGIFNLGTIFLFTAGLLWYYSTNFSKELLIGNIVVAVLTATIPLLVAIYDLVPLYKAYRGFLENFFIDFNYILFWILGFSFFAFISTLSREIVKDMEDLEGDNAYGRNTLPIAAGMPIAKLTVTVLQLLLIGALSASCVLYIEDMLSYSYIGILIALNAYIIWAVQKANNAKDLHKTSNLLKFSMMIGVLYSLIITYNIYSLY